jgi:peroxiredoxin
MRNSTKRFGWTLLAATGLGAGLVLAQPPSQPPSNPPSRPPSNPTPPPPSTPPSTPSTPSTPPTTPPGQTPSQPPAKEPAVKVGQEAPTFILKDVAGKEHDLAAIVNEGKVVVLEWFNPECEWIAKYHGSRLMAETYKKFAGKDVAWFAINSATTGKSADPARTRQAIAEWSITYPVLMDPESKAQKLYGASVTPQIFIIDREGKIGYMGAIDDAKKAGDRAAMNYLDDALTKLSAGETLTSAKTEAKGCQITGPGAAPGGK